ncbi:hypothetical protein HPB49_009445 [Dermacentor silvarum]|uniref:Uncharacterized protein n=1 Tax=Dermacentor silvarum TaxID=543639 RepID=A0ACB8CEC1_DERSI|nr:hypothetical protein HPB49_009445 [Dermacentor silvarum]
MEKLQGVYMRKLNLNNLNITELPASWFTKRVIFSLRITNCSLRDIGQAAARHMTRLFSMRLNGNELQSVPLGLTAARSLQTLTVQKNPIKHLQGMLTFPELFYLDLSRNEIETIDEDYLSGLPKLRYLILTRNNIKILPNLFKKTKLLKEVKLHANRISSIEVFNDLPKLEPKKQAEDIDRLGGKWTLFLPFSAKPVETGGDGKGRGRIGGRLLSSRAVEAAME